MFKTHTGLDIQESSDVYTKALRKVYEGMVESAYKIHEENLYAEHITKEQKLIFLQERLALAEDVLLGKPEVMTFWLWQRLDYELTGEEVSLFSK